MKFSSFFIKWSEGSIKRSSLSFDNFAARYIATVVFFAGSNIQDPSKLAFSMHLVHKSYSSLVTIRGESFIFSLGNLFKVKS